ncbi:ATPase [Jeotgalibacillus alimentarius]|uniref:histidine kinase n=1 Tax=Jeotgalibacillus alimentarius TaxID=135826 RepID=A0A0C2VRI8_9BACL|nr:sensor histidine kinase [Jeotgalibacillus alimentarius]KIL51522.1 ATPase [Jeotgalibacillus alimentarius]
MKTKRRRLSLAAKIISLNIVSILLVMLVFLVISLVIEYKQIERQMGTQAMQLAVTVSAMPTVINAFEEDEPSTVLQPLINRIREETGTAFIVIGNTKGERYAHPDAEKLGKLMVGDDNARALENGEFYISKSEGTLGPSIRGKGPIRNAEGDIVGIVSVGYLTSSIIDNAIERGSVITMISLIVIIFGILSSYLLARNIRKMTLGLEPDEMTSLYQERQAILHSIKEAIISVDEDGYIKILNQSAMDLLNVDERVLNQKVESILPNTGVYEVLESGSPQRDVETTLRNRHVIINRTPVIKNGKVTGVVSTFRDKTEMNKMIETLSEVKRYSEDLRAQTHEFSNKLYILSGLLQLGKYDEAIEMIQAESDAQDLQNKVIFEQIEDPRIQALLLGKAGKASEKKIVFNIEENSSLHILSGKAVSEVASIISNLVDNAFDAAERKTEPVVNLFLTDLGNDIVIEVEDNGEGIPEANLDLVFTTGYSTKGETDRGYGLSIVKQAAENLGGSIEVHSDHGRGTTFSVYLPKNMTYRQKKTS